MRIGNKSLLTLPQLRKNVLYFFVKNMFWLFVGYGKFDLDKKITTTKQLNAKNKNKIQIMTKNLVFAYL